MTRPARLVVDPIACDGRGLCAELLPGLITLDDWGFPVIPEGDLPASLRKEAAAVVRLCPRLALRLEPAAPAGRDRGQIAPPRSRLHAWLTRSAALHRLP
jgi:ferredoxin